MKLYIRVDGNLEIGLGHVVRCTALAYMLAENFKIIFIYKTMPDQLKSQDFSYMHIFNDEEFFNIITRNDIVVLDGYGFDEKYQKVIKTKRCKLVCIDDIFDRKFVADLIINPAPEVNPKEYEASYYTQFAMGLDYVLLRPAFLKLAKKSSALKSTDRAFVCFGGSDFKDITSIVVSLLLQDQRFKHIDIVVGISYNYVDKLKNLIKDDERFVLHKALSELEIIDLITLAGISVVPASGILLEVLALGSRAISGMYADNQKAIFQNLKRQKAFYSAEDFSRENLQKAFKDLFYADYQVPVKLIDGNSGTRILRLFNLLVLEDEITLRKVKSNDLLRTFEWASNFHIRKYFFSSKPIEFDDHKRWFNNKVKDTNCFYYVGLFQSIEFGSIRFDLENNVATVSYLIDPKFHNRGFGTVLLKKGLNLFKSYAPNLFINVKAEVLNENVASIKIFEKLGYTKKLENTEGVSVFEKIIC